MKAEFQILKAKPKIPLVLTRDSVCAGDDCDAPHEKKVEVYSFVDPEAFAKHLFQKRIAFTLFIIRHGFEMKQGPGTSLESI